MSSVFIENYRGYDIMFSTRLEKFQSDIEDGKDKNSLSSARKEIDDFIKVNQNFNPFEVVSPSSLIIGLYNFEEKSAFNIVKAIRKDKALQCEGGQISNYDIESKYNGGKWFVCNKEHKKEVLEGLSLLNEEKNKLMAQISAISEESKRLAEKLKGEPLIYFRNRILGENKITEQ